MSISSCFQSEQWKVHVSAGGSGLLVPFQNVAPECKLTVSEVRFKCTSAIHICGKWHCHYQKCPTTFGSPKSLSVTFEFCLAPKSMLRAKHSQLLQVQVGKVPSTNSVQQLPHGWIWKSPTSCISELSEPFPLNFQRHTNTNTAPWSFGR